VLQLVILLIVIISTGYFIDYKKLILLDIRSFRNIIDVKYTIYFNERPPNYL